MKKILYSLMLIGVCFSTRTFSQISTTNTLSATQLVNQVLLGSGVTASNITFTGNTNQKSKFTATSNTNLGLASGVFLSCGDARTSSGIGPQGPNNNVATSTGYAGNGDSDLDAIVTPNATEDAAVLEFDFIPQSDTVKFRYIFGSEEYNEYVSSSYNDIFAFLLSGPNPSGGTYTNYNIALIPGTTTPISINNVNNGYKANTVLPPAPAQATGPCSNCLYYRDNYNSNINCQFDGITVVLTAKAAVQCGQTYHIKIAVADVGDDALDSGVFLEEGSFSSAPPITVSSNNSNVSFADSVMVEGCNTNCLFFVRNSNVSQKDSFLLQVSGNAINGTDYQQNGVAVPWPSKLVYNANQDTIVFCSLKAIEDNVPEGTDTISFAISTFTNSASSCVGANVIRFNLYIQDYQKITIGQGDSSICNGQSVLLDAQAQYGVPAYTYTIDPGGVNTNTLNTGPVTQVTNYTITVKDICQDRAPETKVVTITPTTLPYLSDLPNYKFCLDSTKKITVTPNNGKPPYAINWLIPAGGVAPMVSTSNTYTFVSTGETPSNGTYTIVLTDQCNITDTLKIDLNIVDCNIIVPNVVTPNGDNINELFVIHGLENFTNSHLYVYNRWGNKIYSSQDYKNDWKPEHTDGTYFYILEINDGRKFKGYFQIFKN